MLDYIINIPDFENIKSNNKIIRKKEFDKVKEQFCNLIEKQNKRVINYEQYFLKEIINYKKNINENKESQTIKTAISNIQKLRKSIKDGIRTGVSIIDTYQNKIPPNVMKIPLVPSLIKKSVSNSKKAAQKLLASKDLSDMKAHKYLGFELGIMTDKTLYNAQNKLEKYFVSTKTEFGKFGIGKCNTVSKMKDLVKSICKLMELKSPESNINVESLFKQESYNKYSHEGFIYNYCKVISCFKKNNTEFNDTIKNVTELAYNTGEEHGDKVVNYKIGPLFNQFKSQDMEKIKSLYEECCGLKPMELWKKRKEFVKEGKTLYDKWSKIFIKSLKSCIIDSETVEKIMENLQDYTKDDEAYKLLMLIVAGGSAGKIAPQVTNWINEIKNILDEILISFPPDTLQKLFDENNNH